MIYQYFMNPTPLVVILNRLRRKFARFKLPAHLLDLRCHSEDGHKIMLDEYTFDVIGYSIRK
jgi:hypothetical protein